ncbi:hypothetical protein AB3S75_000725 [Citrus x aurantiifolia]
MKRACELCSQEAALHCASDEAFLCFDCDDRVHKANFLVARHVRQTLCSQCKSLTGKFISGERSSSSLEPICPSCCSSTTSTSSDCISSTESSAAEKMGRERKRVRACSSSVSDISGEKAAAVADSKAEGIFAIWCRRLGLNGNNSNCNSVVVVSLASRALGLFLERTTALPLRACLAASFWFGLRMCGDKTVATWPNLRRLEAISGVPAKLIVAVEGKIARVMAVRRRRPRQVLEEGWAECNV